MSAKRDDDGDDGDDDGEDGDGDDGVYKRLSAIVMGMCKRETALMFSGEPRSHSARNRINIQRKRLY